jgi:hypothetical protein
MDAADLAPVTCAKGHTLPAMVMADPFDDGRIACPVCYLDLDGETEPVRGKREGKRTP